MTDQGDQTFDAGIAVGDLRTRRVATDLKARVGDICGGLLFEPRQRIGRKVVGKVFQRNCQCRLGVQLVHILPTWPTAARIPKPHHRARQHDAAGDGDVSRLGHAHRITATVAAGWAMHDNRVMTDGEGQRMAPGFLSREHVLEATLTCCASHGARGLTIRVLAEELGCAVGSIYRYFRDKDELVAAAAVQMLRPTVDEATFEASVRLYVEAAQANVDLYRTAMSTEPLPQVNDVIAHWSAQLGDEQLAKQRWALVHGLIVLNESPDRIVEIASA